MKTLLFTLLILVAIAYVLYVNAMDFFSNIKVNYQILGNQIQQGTQLVLRINVFSPRKYNLTITNPIISVYDNNGNLLVRLDLLAENKKVKLQQGDNQYDFKILEKLQFQNTLDLTQVKTFFSARIYGVDFTKQIPNQIN
jgi:hypothetical protein